MFSAKRLACHSAVVSFLIIQLRRLPRAGHNMTTATNQCVASARMGSECSAGSWSYLNLKSIILSPSLFCFQIEKNTCDGRLRCDHIIFLALLTYINNRKQKYYSYYYYYYNSYYYYPTSCAILPPNVMSNIQYLVLY